MNTFTRFLLRAALALTLLSAAGCAALLSGGNQPANSGEEGTPAVPTPTPDLAGYQNLTGRACLVAQGEILRTGQLDNRSLAWSPDGTRLAYLAPTLMHRWFLGDLVVLSGKDFSEKSVLAANATGGLTWSPGGDRLAYVAMRPQEKMFTAMVVGASGGTPRDLFPAAAAQTDSFSSPKTIMSWQADNRLYVSASCGDGCSQYYEINPGTGVRREVDANRVISNRPRSYAEDEFPLMITPSWSRDGKRVAYFDDDGRLWALSVEDHLATEIIVTGYTPVDIFAPADQEMAWSADGRLAVRLDDRYEIYDFPCQAQ